MDLNKEELYTHHAILYDLTVISDLYVHFKK